MRAVTSSSFCRVFGSSRPRFLGLPPAPHARCSPPRRAPGDAAAGDGASASSGAAQLARSESQKFMLQTHLLRGR